VSSYSILIGEKNRSTSNGYYFICVYSDSLHGIKEEKYKGYPWPEAMWISA